MQKSYKGYFAAVLIFIDAVVLGLSFGFLHAPSHYYVCLGLILAATVFYEIYRFQKGLRDFLDDHADIPFFYAFLVLACSLVFLRVGAMDMVSLVKTPSMVLNNSQFTMREEKFLGIFPHTAYVLEGSKVEEEKNQDNEKNQDGDESEEKAETYSFYITKDIYNSLSYALPAEELESDSKTQSYSYSPSAEFTVSYLSGSRKVKDVAMKTTAQETENESENEDVYVQETPDYETIEAQILSVTDNCTMTAKITNLKSYSGKQLKKGQEITIHSPIDILYPFNVQGFYEIKEGDTVEFYVHSVSQEEGTTVETEALNLVTAP